MNRLPLASVIINNYNYGRFLPDAIDSALTQTYAATEVIVVDDGSTDNSREVIAKYGDHVISVLKENGGQASAVNAGIEASHGDAILFLDSDDMLLPTAVARAMPFFADSRVSRVHWRLREIDQQGQPTGRVTPKGRLKQGDLKSDTIRMGYSASNPSPGGATGNAFASNFLSKVSPVRSSGDGHGAYGYLYTLAPIYGLLCRIEEPLGLRRVHGTNYSGQRTIKGKLERDLRRHRYLCDVLSAHLNAMGIPVEPAAWEGPNSYYAWMQQVLSLLEQIAELVPQGHKMILVDEGHLGTDCVHGRQIVPFLEHNGQYWGRPVNDRIAVRELTRLRDAGASFVVFTPWTFWWLASYPALDDYLRGTARCVARSDTLVAFDLSSSEGDGNCHATE